METRFVRLQKLVGSEKMELLRQKKVLIIGCGGVGGYVCEALARSGVGSFVLVDFDIIDETNINRQIIALESTIGKKKIEVLAGRVADINSKCCIKKIDQFIDENNLEDLFLEPLDYVIDACDTMSTKKALIEYCTSHNIPFVSCMGTGNKFDPSMLEITKIQNTQNDPLARVLRKYVKDQKIKEPVIVLSSKELPIKTGDRTPGSTSFVPSSAGLLIASYIVRKWVQ